jgi:predicted kinase
MTSQKFVFIMRGVPGSFKTTTANHLAGKKGRVHSVDNLHTHCGLFLWEDDKAKERYQQNFEMFRESCQLNVPVVVCDCMNLTKDDYKKYIDVAQEYGYIACTVVMQSLSPKEAANRNEHDVSEEQIRHFLDRWED